MPPFADAAAATIRLLIRCRYKMPLFRRHAYADILIAAMLLLFDAATIDFRFLIRRLRVRRA